MGADDVKTQNRKSLLELEREIRKKFRKKLTSPALIAAFWIQAEIMRVNPGVELVLPSRRTLSEIIEKEIPSVARL